MHSMARFLAWLNKYGDSALAACWYQRRFSFVSIEVGLSSVMTTFRWDMTPHRTFTDRNVAEIVSKAIPAKNPCR
jgi:hypothetical protein